MPAARGLSDIINATASAEAFAKFGSIMWDSGAGAWTAGSAIGATGNKYPVACAILIINDAVLSVMTAQEQVVGYGFTRAGTTAAATLPAGLFVAAPFTALTVTSGIIQIIYGSGDGTGR